MNVLEKCFVKPFVKKDYGKDRPKIDQSSPLFKQAQCYFGHYTICFEICPLSQ